RGSDRDLRAAGVAGNREVSTGHNARKCECDLFLVGERDRLRRAGVADGQGSETQTTDGKCDRGGALSSKRGGLRAGTCVVSNAKGSRLGSHRCGCKRKADRATRMSG